MRKANTALADKTDAQVIAKIADSKNPKDVELWKRYREEERQAA
jgi:hypothetical protein